MWDFLWCTLGILLAVRESKGFKVMHMKGEKKGDVKLRI